MRIGCLGRALGLTGRVAQGEDDRFLIEVGHLLDHFRSEHVGDGSGADKTRRLDVSDDLHQVGHRGVVMGKGFLGLTDASLRTVFDNKTLGVSKPNSFKRLLP